MELRANLGYRASLSHPFSYSFLSSSADSEPPNPLLPTIVYLQALFLRSWLQIIIGLIKAIIIGTFQGVLCIQLHLCMVKWIEETDQYGLKGLLDYFRKLFAQN